jgi:hypothetical protein
VGLGAQKRAKYAQGSRQKQMAKQQKTMIAAITIAMIAKTIHQKIE